MIAREVEQEAGLCGRRGREGNGWPEGKSR